MQDTFLKWVIRLALGGGVLLGLIYGATFVFNYVVTTIF